MLRLMDASSELLLGAPRKIQSVASSKLPGDFLRNCYWDRIGAELLR